MSSPTTVEYLKHLMVRTPLESPVKELRSQWAARRCPILRPLLEQGRCFDDIIIRQILKPDSNCIDVGAHLGSALGHMLRVAPMGKHIAFEPVGYKARWLRKKFPEVQVFEVCLSNTAGQLPFYYHRYASGTSSLRAREGRTAEYDVVSVECARLDDIVPQERRIDLIKIDVEGAELEVLQGATRVLAQSQPYLIIECTAASTQTFGRTPDAVYDFLCDESGYAIFLACEWVRGGIPMRREEFGSVSLNPPRSYDFFCVPRSKLKDRNSG